MTLLQSEALKAPLTITIFTGSSKDEQVNRFRQLLGHVGRDAAAKQLGHRRSLRCPDDEEVYSHCSCKIDNGRGGVLAHGVKRNYVDATLAPEFEHRAHDGVRFRIILPFGATKRYAGCGVVNGHLLDIEHKESGLA